MKIIYVSNAGIIIKAGTATIWIDVLHDENDYGYGCLSDEMIGKLRSDGNLRPDVIAFTHCHKDHYSKKLADAFMRTFKNAILVSPENKPEKQTGLFAAVETLNVSGTKLTFVKTDHQPCENAGGNHYSCIVEAESRIILVMGDAALDVIKEVRKTTDNFKINIAVLPFPWICRRDGIKMVIDTIKPEEILVCHLPVKKESTFTYYMLAEKACLRLNDYGIKSEILEKPFYEIDYKSEAGHGKNYIY